MEKKFQRGLAYFATPTTGGQQRIFVTVSCRAGRVSFVDCKSVTGGEIRNFEGRETALVKSEDGRDYFVSASVEADIEGAADVLEALGV